MKDGRSNNGGTKGNKGGRVYPDSQLKKFWTALDLALPNVVDFCLGIIEESKKSKNRADKALGLKAAQILISKAPQRIIGGDDDSPVILKILNADSYAI